jgi:hypothetical protein
MADSSHRLTGDLVMAPPLRRRISEHSYRRKDRDDDDHDDQFRQTERFLVLVLATLYRHNR